MTMMRTKEDKGVASGGPSDSKRSKHCLEMSRTLLLLWARFGEFYWLLLDTLGSVWYLGTIWGLLELFLYP